MPDYTTTALLASIRRRGSIPTAATLGAADSDLLAIASEVLASKVAPWVRSAREDFFATSHTVATVAGASSYALPARAIAGGLQEVEVLDAAGSCVRDLERIPRNRRTRWSQDNGTPAAFYFEDGRLVLVPTPDAAETLRLPYFRRCGVLVATSAVAVISAINTGTGAVTLSATIPATFTTSKRYDFIGANPGFGTLAMDLTASVASGTGMTFAAADLPSTLAVGDYVCIAGEAPVAQVPPEWHHVLAQATAVEWLRGPNGDRDMLPMAEAELESLRTDILGVTTPRVEGERVTVAQCDYF